MRISFNVVDLKGRFWQVLEGQEAIDTPVSHHGKRLQRLQICLNPIRLAREAECRQDLRV